MTARRALGWVGGVASIVACAGWVATCTDSRPAEVHTAPPRRAVVTTAQGMHPPPRRVRQPAGSAVPAAMRPAAPRPWQPAPPLPRVTNRASAAQWAARLAAARTASVRAEALANLQRLLGALNRRNRAGLAKFRRAVVPMLVKAFPVRIGRGYPQAQTVVKLAVECGASSARATRWLLSILSRSHRKGAVAYAQPKPHAWIAYRAVQGVLQIQKARRKPVPGAFAAFAGLIARTGKARYPFEHQYGPGAPEPDPRDELRVAITQSLRGFARLGVPRKKIVAVLITVIEQGLTAYDDPMAVIHAVRHLGEAGGAEPATSRALVKGLYGVLRGRRLTEFALAALAKLPADAGGRHPALRGLMQLVRGDPWRAEMAALEKRIRSGAGRGEGLSRRLARLRKQYKAKKKSPRCPLSKSLGWVCGLYWRAHVQQWRRVEPQVLVTNALYALAELGDRRIVPSLLKRFGAAAVQARWLRRARQRTRLPAHRLPGVLAQQSVIPGYDADLGVRMALMTVLGRLDAPKHSPAAKKELLRSLRWSGDPKAIRAAAHAMSLASPDDALMTAVLGQARRAASLLMISEPLEQARKRALGYLFNGSCSKGRELSETFKKCLGSDSRADKDARRWKCQDKHRSHWIRYLRHWVGYHEPGEYKELVLPFCREEHHWYLEVRPGLEKKVKAGDQSARAQLYACRKRPPKRGRGVRCQTWSRCDERNGFLCLDGHWTLRMELFLSAAVVATKKHARKLLRLKARDIMRKHKLRAKGLPARGKSAFYHPDTKRYLTARLWTGKVEKARRRKAREVIEQRLCQGRKWLWVVKACGDRIACYLKVAQGKGRLRLPRERCETLRAPFRRGRKKGRPDGIARAKAWRMLVFLGGRLAPTSPVRKKIIRAAVVGYARSEDAPRSERGVLRSAVVSVLDRLASYPAHKGLRCRYVAPKSRRGKPVGANLRGSQPCFRLLGRVLVDETARGVRGAWWYNRRTWMALGRLARRGGVPYRKL